MPIAEILTVPDVARLFKVVEKTIYTMAQNAEIPAFKVRGQWRFRRLDIDAWIEQMTTAIRPVRKDSGQPKNVRKWPPGSSQ